METPFALAVIVAFCVTFTADALALNCTVVAVGGTVTDEGTATARLLLERLTANPELGAAAFRVTVQESETAPVKEPLLQVTPLRATLPDCEVAPPLP